MTGDIHTLAGAYALDALSDPERAAFERHLADCGTCAVEVAELVETAARLADRSWSVPPPRLRERVLAQAARTRQLPPRRIERTIRSPRSRSGWRRWAMAAAAAVVLAAAGGTAGYLVQQQRVDQAQTAAEQAEQRTDQIRTVLAAPDAALRHGEVTGGGRLTLVISPRQDAAVVALSGVTPPGRDQAYQLWLIGDAGPVSAGVLPAGVAGDTLLVQGVGQAVQVGLTREPAGGSPTPTEPILAAVPVA